MFTLYKRMIWTMSHDSNNGIEVREWWSWAASGRSYERTDQWTDQCNGPTNGPTNGQACWFSKISSHVNERGNIKQRLCFGRGLTPVIDFSDKFRKRIKLDTGKDKARPSLITSLFLSVSKYDCVYVWDILSLRICPFSSLGVCLWSIHLSLSLFNH